MESYNKRAHKLAVIMLLLIVGILCSFIYSSIVSSTNFNAPIGNGEKRLIIYSFLLLLFFILMVLIMIRNAFTVNTAFLIRFKESLNKNGQSLDMLTRKLTDTIRSVDTLNKTMKNESEKSEKSS